MKTDENLEISVISTVEESASILTEGRRRKCGATRRCLRSLVPSSEQCSGAVTKLLVLLLLYGALFGALDALPGSEIFALLLLALLSATGGKVLGILRLPPLVGMLIVGFLFRNLPFIPFHQDISRRTASLLRDVALVILLLSSGLGLDGEKLKRMKMTVVQLTCIPLLVETGSMAVFSHYFLNLPWLWGIMLGFEVSAVSVAVILPVLLRLRASNLGSDRGLPTLILAAASMDDIVAIAGFTVTLGVVFTGGENLTLILIKAPLEPLVGCAIGAVFGVIFWHLPSREGTSKAFLVYYHVLLLSFGGLSILFVTVRAGMSGSGAVGCITLAFVASLRWRRDPEQFVGIETVVSVFWKIVEPFMFALIGAEVSVANIDSSTGCSVLVIFLSLLCRALVTPFVTFGANLNVKEKIFVSCAWLPKATVQAAVGSRALDYARLDGRGDDFIRFGQQVLTVSVLSIVLTAPLGAALTSLLGPVLLNRTTTDVDAPGTPAGTTEDAVTGPSPANYGSCHPLQPSDILPPPKAVDP